MEDDFGQIGNDQQLFDGVDQQIIDEEPYEQLDEDILDEELPQWMMSLINNLLILEATTTLTTPSLLPSNDIRAEDMADEAVCQKFGCGCSENCYKKFSPSHLIQQRYELAELSRDELDLVVMSQLMATTHFQSTTTGRKNKKIPRVRSKMYSTFYHSGERICKSTFLFLHNVGEGKLKRIKSSFLNNGLKSRYKTLVVNNYYYYLTE